MNTLPVHVPDDVLYRYYERKVGVLDHYGEDIIDSYLKLSLDKYPVLKRTPKGAWIRHYGPFSSRKFVLLTARRKFACDTKADALESFIARKESHIRHLRARLTTAEKALQLGQAKLKLQSETEHEICSANTAG